MPSIRPFPLLILTMVFTLLSMKNPPATAHCDAGLSFTFGNIITDSNSQYAWYTLKGQIKDTLAALNSTLKRKKRIKGSIDQKSIDELYELVHRIGILEKVLKNLDRLEHSPQAYALEYIKGGQGITEYDIDSQKIVLRILADFPAESFVHETTHGGQFESGEIVYRRVKKIGDHKFPGRFGGSLGDDYDDEVAAYKAQYAFSPASVLTAHSLENITESWVMEQKLGDDKIYAPGSSSNIALIPITIDSDRKHLIYAFPNDSTWKLRDSLYTLRYDTTYIHR